MESNTSLSGISTSGMSTSSVSPTSSIQSPVISVAPTTTFSVREVQLPAPFVTNPQSIVTSAPISSEPSQSNALNTNFSFSTIMILSALGASLVVSAAILLWICCRNKRRRKAEENTEAVFQSFHVFNDKGGSGYGQSFRHQSPGNVSLTSDNTAVNNNLSYHPAESNHQKDFGEGKSYGPAHVNYMYNIPTAIPESSSRPIINPALVIPATNPSIHYYNLGNAQAPPNGDSSSTPIISSKEIRSARPSTRQARPSTVPASVSFNATLQNISPISIPVIPLESQEINLSPVTPIGSKPLYSYPFGTPANGNSELFAHTELFEIFNLDSSIDPASSPLTFVSEYDDELISPPSSTRLNSAQSRPRTSVLLSASSSSSSPTSSILQKDGSTSNSKVRGGQPSRRSITSSVHAVDDDPKTLQDTRITPRPRSVANVPPSEAGVRRPRSIVQSSTSNGRPPSVTRPKRISSINGRRPHSLKVETTLDQSIDTAVVYDILLPPSVAHGSKESNRMQTDHQKSRMSVRPETRSARPTELLESPLMRMVGEVGETHSANSRIRYL